MKVLFLNNSGSGFADYIEVPQGTTVEELFKQHFPDGYPEDFLIRVNRQPVARDYTIQDGDRVTVTPSKIEGARQAA